jgi:hypothetical protein
LTSIMGEPANRQTKKRPTSTSIALLTGYGCRSLKGYACRVFQAAKFREIHEEMQWLNFDASKDPRAVECCNHAGPHTTWHTKSCRLVTPKVVKLSNRSFFFFIALEHSVEQCKSLGASITNPPRNRFTTRRSCNS